MKGDASVAMMVTLPPDWAQTLRVEVRCPGCYSLWLAHGAGAMVDIATYVNDHHCPNQPTTM